MKGQENAGVQRPAQISPLPMRCRMSYFLSLCLPSEKHQIPKLDRLILEAQQEISVDLNS